MAWVTTADGMVHTSMERRRSGLASFFLRFIWLSLSGNNAAGSARFEDGIFLMAGRLQPDLGSGIVAHDTTLSDLQSRVNDDPFVAEKVVSAEILEITPSKADERLSFLLG
jgi:hypothetical protein